MILIENQRKKNKFEQIFFLYFPKVKAFAWKILQSEDDAEDIAQEVFIKMWDRPEVWLDGEINQAYMFTMVRNQIFNFLKHKSVENSYLDSLDAIDLQLSDFDVYDKIYAKELKIIINLTLDNMPEQRRKVFLLSRKHGLSNQEIAEKLQLSVRTVERHIYLALSELKKIILLTFFFVFD